LIKKTKSTYFERSRTKLVQSFKMD